MKSVLLAAAAAVALSGCMIIAVDHDDEARSEAEEAAATATEAADAVVTMNFLYEASVADSRRPADEIARDEFRKPLDMLWFSGAQPGWKVADIRPGAGYFTRLFAPVVGPAGKVYAFIPNLTKERENPRAEPLLAYGNVAVINGDLDEFSPPEPLDLIFVSQEYHDFHIDRFDTDVPEMNRRFYAALKPGGRLMIIDHAGAAGTGITEIQTLHRIEGAQVRREFEAAGFVFEEESRAVANAADDRTLNVFDEAIRGRTDQFVYRFRKPN